MAITVTMYKNFSKKYNSTKQPLLTDGHTDFTCTIKDNTSVLDPVLDLYLTGTDPADTPIGSGYNYAYISKWHRYYFITNWRYNKGVWIASLAVDVLASYKTEIGSLTKYVTRSASSYDLDIADKRYPAKADAHLSYIAGDNPYRQSSGCYIVGIIGQAQSGAPSVGGINYYCFTTAQMGEFITYLTSSSWAAALSDSSVGFTDDVVKSLVNPLDYIESCIWLPFIIDLNTTGTKIQPKLGWWDNIDFIKNGYPGDSTKWGLTPMYYGNTFDDIVLSPSSTITWTKTMTISDHSQIARGNWLNAAPYSYYTFHLDPWGDIPLDPSIMMNNKTISFDIHVEGISGIGVLEIFSGSKLLVRKTAPLGVNISIAQIITDYSSSFTRTGIAIGGAAGLASGGSLKKLWEQFKAGDYSTSEGAKANEAAMREAAGLVGSDIMNGVLAYNSEMTTTGVAGSPASYIFTTISGTPNMYTNGAWIKIVRFNLVSEDLADNGRPLCSTTSINSLSGYLECRDGEHNIAALDSEKAAISNYLTGGFFYE